MGSFVRSSSFTGLCVITLLVYSGMASARRRATRIKNQSSCYTAAIYEYAPEEQEDYWSTMKANLRNYQEATTEAKQQGADIIVFPEKGIVTNTFLRNRTEVIEKAERIPDPETENFNPCNNKTLPESSILKNLSCSAQENSIYLVANTVDIKPCYNTTDDINSCPEDEHFIYNTNVIFDRTGRLIARYHKRYLFFEDTMDPAPKFEHVYVDTELGRLGTFVCFDIIFGEAEKFIDNYNINTLVFPTQWHEELPLNSAPSVQQSVAIYHNINVLAANTNVPSLGSFGSGIYSGHRGPVNYTHIPDGQSKLLIGKIPRNKRSVNDTSGNQCENHGGEILVPRNPKQDPFIGVNDFADYALVLLENTSGKVKACHGDFCCRLKYEVRPDYRSTSQRAFEHGDYYLAVHRGMKDILGTIQWCEETCILLRCEHGASPICSKIPTTTSTIFNRIKLSGNFTTSYVYPVVIGTKLRLVPTKEWNYSMDNDDTSIATISVKSKWPILVTGLNGRCYDRDPTYVQIKQSSLA